MIWAMVLAASPAEAAYRELVKAPAQVEVRELEQTFFPGQRFFAASAWAEGGHRELEKLVFAGRDVVIADYENVDENGYHRRLKSLRVCPLEHERAIRAAKEDIGTLTKLVEERATKCSALPIKLPAKEQLDAFAAFILTLAGEGSTARMLKNESELKGQLQWVNGKVPFAPWVKTFDGKRFAGLGMVQSGQYVELVEVRFDGTLTVVRKTVAFERRYIE